MEQDIEPFAAADLVVTATPAPPVPSSRHLARHGRSAVGVALTLLLGGVVATAGLLVVDGRPAGQPGVARSVGAVFPAAWTSAVTFRSPASAAPTGAPAGPWPAPLLGGTGPDGLGRPGGSTSSQLPVVGALVPWSFPGASVSVGATAGLPSWAGTAPVDSGSYPLAVIAAGRGHSWGQVRSALAATLELVALRQAQLGVPLNG